MAASKILGEETANRDAAGSGSGAGAGTGNTAQEDDDRSSDDWN